MLNYHNDILSNYNLAIIQSDKINIFYNSFRSNYKENCIPENQISNSFKSIPFNSDHCKKDSELLSSENSFAKKGRK